MRRSITAVEALLDELWLDPDEFCRAAGVDPPWIEERVADGLVSPKPLGPGGAWRFDATMIRRVRCMARIERDFEALPELAALVADLEDEVATLRAQLAGRRRA